MIPTQEIKTDDNTPPWDIDFFTNPATKTIIDRYLFASQYMRDKRVLDLGCAFGVGSALLYAMGAKSVFGIDKDPKAMKYAHKRYQRYEIHFRRMDFIEKPLYPDKFDAAVCIEVFEHIDRKDVPILLSGLRATVVNGGTIFLTTPRRKIPIWNVEGGTHKYEYTFDEFKDEIRAFFPLKNVTFHCITELLIANDKYADIKNMVSIMLPADDGTLPTSAVMVAVITNDK